MKSVAARGATLATQSFGDGRRGTILLVMGATASMVWWPLPLCEALAAGGYPVIRFDHRDTGQSSTNEPGVVDYDLTDLAEDLVAIMDAYGIAQAHLVGMSLGALAAQLLAVQQPSRVASLTLIAAEPLGLGYDGEGIAPKFLEHFGRMATLDWSDHAAARDFLVTIAELSAGSALPFDRAAATARVEEELSRTTSMQSAFNHAMIAGALPDGMTADRIRVPTLILHGTEDPIISAAAAMRSAGAIEGARLLLLEGRGHELAPDDLKQIGSEILAHVSGQHGA